MSNTHPNPHSNLQQNDTSNLQPTDPNPNSPGFLMNGEPDPNHVPDNHNDHNDQNDQNKKKGWPWWAWALIALFSLAVLFGIISALSGGKKDATKPTTEKPADPNLTQPPVAQNPPNTTVNPNPVNPPAQALTPEQQDSIMQEKIAKAVADALAKAQQQPAQPGGSTAKGGSDVPVIPGVTVIETCLTARPAVGVVYWCRDTKEFQYRKSQKLQLPGHEWPK